MLRFRPILPKPAPTEGALSVGTQNVVVSRRRPKRKYVRVRRKNGYAVTNGKGFEKRETPELKDAAAPVTLQLMPEKDSPEGTSLAGVSRCENVGLELGDLAVDNPKPKPPCATTENADAGAGWDPVAQAAARVVVVESWVTVESVTGTCIVEGGGGELGCTDAEKVKNLEIDTCPGFISDGYFRVRWVNDAFKKMVESEEREVVVWLKVKDGAAAAAAAWRYSYPAFTCGVRWQYTWRDEKCTKMVPCDVWRLDCGGFAWRLDVKAALSLGL